MAMANNYQKHRHHEVSITKHRELYTAVGNTELIFDMDVGGFVCAF
jgi:hypothetical protein